MLVTFESKFKGVLKYKGLGNEWLKRKEKTVNINYTVTVSSKGKGTE